MSFADDKKEAIEEMSIEEFKEELDRSVIVLSTSSPDKRDIYRVLFSELGKNQNHEAGLNAYFTDSGALGISTAKTHEMTNDYDGNLGEKRDQQLRLLESPQIKELIGLKLHAVHNQLWSEDGIKVVGMTEDSGWQLDFEDKATEKAFIDIIVREMEPKIRPQDKWLIEKLHKTGFPGPNLKPLQEHLEGGFTELMNMIYNAADELNLKELRYTNTTNISFVSPRNGKFFPIKETATGRLLTREEFSHKLDHMVKGEALNTNFVQVPEGQANGEQQTVAELIRNGLHTKSSAELPASYARRAVAEKLQGLIGKRRSSRSERLRPVNIAYVTPERMEDKHAPIDAQIPIINDYRTVGVPTYEQLVHYPDIKQFDYADVVMLMPQMHVEKNGQLRSDPNLRLMLNVLVTIETDPESMGIPVILDNRTGKFNKALELLSDAFAQGRIMGELPFYVVNNDEELRRALQEVKDIRQRTPIIKKHHDDTERTKPKEHIETVPNDGIYTVFVGGGHATNSKRDMEDAKQFGYYCASQGWRIVTGAGSVEGSMGSVHTGFIQYHLDQFMEKHKDDAEYAPIRAQLAPFAGPDGHYDAEKVILQKPRLLNEMADSELIPRDMFYGYSMKPLLEMESPSGKAPPAITYFEAGNRFRRLHGLLSPGTKVFMPGGVGTDEELEETIRQHVTARLNKQVNGNANDNVFSDGTPDDEGTMIIYNRNGNLDKLLAHYGLLGDDPVTINRRKRNNIHIITSVDKLESASVETATKWKERVEKGRSATQDSQNDIAV